DAALHHDLRRRDETVRRPSEDPDSDAVSLAAHETGRGLPFVRRSDLWTETWQARGRAKTSAGLSASGERRDGSFHHERARTRRRSRSSIGKSRDRTARVRLLETGAGSGTRKETRAFQ